MSAEVTENTLIYYCPVCGPCLRELLPKGELTVHRDIPHPPELTYDEDERPQ